MRVQVSELVQEGSGRKAPEVFDTFGRRFINKNIDGVVSQDLMRSTRAGDEEVKSSVSFIHSSDQSPYIVMPKLLATG